MSFPQRLPEVNNDDGQWGDILNQFLSKEHYNNDNGGLGIAASGGHQNITVQPGSALLAPLTFTTGPLLTTAAAGSVEFLTNKLYYTSTTPTRYTVAAYASSSTVAAGDLHYADGTGTLTTLPIGTSTGMVLTVSGGLPVWQALGGGQTQQQTMAINSMRI